MKTKLKLIIGCALVCSGFASPLDEGHDHFVAQDLRNEAAIAGNWQNVFGSGVVLPPYWVGYFQGRADALREAADKIEAAP